MTVATLLPLTNRSAAPGLDRWDPARWNRRRLRTPNGLAAAELVTVFGHGGHSCPARPFSLAAMTLTSRRLLSQFRWEPSWSGASRSGLRPDRWRGTRGRTVSRPLLATLRAQWDRGASATAQHRDEDAWLTNTNTKSPKQQRERRCGSPSGEPCTSRSIRRPTSSRTRSVFGWPRPTTVGVDARTWIRTAPGGSGRALSPAPASSRTSWPSRPQHGVTQYVILGAGLDTFAQRQAGAGVASPGLRGRPARPAGLEAATPRRARVRCAGVAAAGAGRLRARRIVVGPARRGRLRSRAPGRRRLHRRDALPLQGGQRRHLAPDRRARARIDARHDLSRCRPNWSTMSCGLGSRRPRRAPAPPGHPSSASTRRTK